MSAGRLTLERIAEITELAHSGVRMPLIVPELLGHIAALDAELKEWQKMRREAGYAIENQERGIKERDAQIAALTTKCGQLMELSAALKQIDGEKDMQIAQLRDENDKLIAENRALVKKGAAV